MLVLDQPVGLDFAERILRPQRGAFAAAGVEQAGGLLDLRDRLVRHAPPAQALDIHAAHGLVIPEHLHVGGHVVRDAGHAADVGIAADGDEVVHPGGAPDHDTVLHAHVAGELNRVGDDDVVADVGVVGDVDPDHEEVVIADARDAAALSIDLRAAVNGDQLAEDVVGARGQPGRPALVLQVLGRGAEDAARVEYVSGAEIGRAEERGAGADDAAVAEAHVRPDIRERADLHVGAELDLRINECGRMYHAHVFASAASVPSRGDPAARSGVGPFTLGPRPPA